MYLLLFLKDRKGELTCLFVVTVLGQCDVRHHTVRSNGTVCGAGVCGLHPATEITRGTGGGQAAATRPDAHHAGQMCETSSRSAEVCSDANWPWIKCFVCYLDYSMS
jgi:hypothetical protein